MLTTIFFLIANKCLFVHYIEIFVYSIRLNCRITIYKRSLYIIANKTSTQRSHTRIIHQTLHIGTFSYNYTTHLYIRTQ